MTLNSCSCSPHLLFLLPLTDSVDCNIVKVSRDEEEWLRTRIIILLNCIFLKRRTDLFSSSNLERHFFFFLDSINTTAFSAEVRWDASSVASPFVCGDSIREFLGSWFISLTKQLTGVTIIYPGHPTPTSLLPFRYHRHRRCCRINSTQLSNSVMDIMGNRSLRFVQRRGINSPPNKEFTWSLFYSHLSVNSGGTSASVG